MKYWSDSKFSCFVLGVVRVANPSTLEKLIAVAPLIVTVVDVGAVPNGCHVCPLPVWSAHVVTSPPDDANPRDGVDHTHTSGNVVGFG